MPVLSSARNDEGLTFARGGSILYFARSDPYTPLVAVDPAVATSDLWQVEVTPIVDFDANGEIAIEDLRMLIDNWGTDDSLFDIGPMPFGDDKVDIEDLKVFITYWEKADAAGLGESL